MASLETPINFLPEQLVMLYEEVPAYLSSKALASSKKVQPGTYKVIQVADDARHPIKLLTSGKHPEVWVDQTKLFKAPCGYFVGDIVYVNEDILSYQNSMDTESNDTVISNYYVIHQTNDGAKHPVNLSVNNKELDSWVDTAHLELKSMQMTDLIK